MDRGRCPVVTMLVVVMMLVDIMMIVGVQIGGEVAANEEREAAPGNEHSRRHSEPWVKLLRHDPLRGIQRDDT